MRYEDYKFKKIKDDLYILYRFEEKEEEAAEFNLKGEYKIYPEFKGLSLGYIIKSFIKDLNKEK